MKYYSEITKKAYDTEKDCILAEKEYNNEIAKQKAIEEAKTKERTARAKNIEKLYTEAADAKRAYTDALRSFIEDYGSFHTTFKSVEPFFSFFDLF